MDNFYLYEIKSFIFCTNYIQFEAIFPIVTFTLTIMTIVTFTLLFIVLFIYLFTRKYQLELLLDYLVIANKINHAVR